ncbi:MAG: LpxL/LpxP family Kdo(2)-lipid IV(A) lauroyl/palmitoleoyl acyltransferase [Proteobacteria bacterium]|nr:LpxL/LpxP family Kdo(2)-lipid IV(A) lauroyl/palmitoleoyl acyltransferase [Pseudomonadota bacterium]
MLLQPALWQGLKVLEVRGQNGYYRAMQDPSSARPSLLKPALWPAWLLVGFMWLVARLPLSGLFFLGKIVGALGYHLARSRRHIAEVNIAKCFPELSDVQRRQLVRANFRHTGIGAVEIALPWLNPKRDLSDHYRVEGLGHLRAAQAQGRGVVLVGAHYTTIDVTGQFLGRLEFVDVMYRRNKHPVWEWLQTRGRRHFFDGVIERSDMRQIIKRLKAGRAMWYAADQDYGRKHSVFAAFFNIPTATITVSSRLAERNQSPTLMLHQLRDIENQTWTLRFSPILEGFGLGDNESDAARLNEMLEQSVRDVPDQYLWVHRRFKTRPDGEDSFYRKG